MTGRYRETGHVARRRGRRRAVTKAQGSIALVMTVRDERVLLRANLLYHHFLGVDRCFVYDDGSVDGTLDTISDLPFVVVRRSADAATTPVPSALAQALDRDFFVWRQLLNVVQALDDAQASGIDWLVAIDADELVALDRRVARPNALAQALHGQPRSVDAVLFRPLEVLQRREAYGDVMVEETLFKRDHPGATRTTWNPFTNQVVRIPILYGHRNGKMAVRVKAGTQPRTIHRFVGPTGRSLATRAVGDLLHYYSHDFEAFRNKFRLISAHPDHHLHGGPVVLQKRLWRDVVNHAGLDDEQLREYYRRWVMFDEALIDRLSRPRRFRLGAAPIVEVTSIRDLMSAGASSPWPPVSLPADGPRQLP